MTNRELDLQTPRLTDLKCGDCQGLQPQLSGCGHSMGGGGSTKTKQKKNANAISEKQQQKLVTDCTEAVNGVGKWRETDVLSWG